MRALYLIRPILCILAIAYRYSSAFIAARLMVLEYCKYLAILGREAFLSLGPKEKADGVDQKAGGPAKEAS